MQEHLSSVNFNPLEHNKQLTNASTKNIKIKYVQLFLQIFSFAFHILTCRKCRVTYPLLRERGREKEKQMKKEI